VVLGTLLGEEPKVTVTGPLELTVGHWVVTTHKGKEIKREWHFVVNDAGQIMKGNHSLGAKSTTTRIHHHENYKINC